MPDALVTPVPPEQVPPKIVKPVVPLAALVAAVFLLVLSAAVLAALAVWNLEIARTEREIFSTSVKHEPHPQVDRDAYDAKMRQIAHVDAAAAKQPGSPQTLWPVKAAYPNAGAILPFRRIIAYYGNFYAKGMGVLGEYPENVMIGMFNGEMKKWQAADPTTPVVPAVDYIAVSAQGSPGADGKYRARMPGSQIDKAIALADKLGGIVILEVQVGGSDVMTEVKLLAPYLINPKVHLAIDPEFAMHGGVRPGTVVGTVDAKDVNAVAKYLAELVRAHNLTPKVLIVHRYTQKMVTNAAKIVPLPDVQILMDMDGWGPPEKKLSTYKSYIYSEPVQFTGFKLFYKNDIKREGSQIMTPEEILKLTPQPLFIQFQ